MVESGEKDGGEAGVVGMCELREDWEASEEREFWVQPRRTNKDGSIDPATRVEEEGELVVTEERGEDDLKITVGL